MGRTNWHCHLNNRHILCKLGFSRVTLMKIGSFKAGSHIIAAVNSKSGLTIGTII